MWILDYLFAFFSALSTTMRSYPALYDSLKVVVAGAFFEISRRGLQYFSHAVMDSLTVKARVGNNDEAYEWLCHYFANHVPLSVDAPRPAHRPDPSNQSSQAVVLGPSSTDIAYSVKTLIFESIWPQGKAAPRDVQLSTHKPNSRYRYMDVDDDQGRYTMGDELGSQAFKVVATPTVGLSHRIVYQGRTIKMGIVRDDDERYGRGLDKWFLMSTFLGTHAIFASLLETAKAEFKLLTNNRTCIYTPRHSCGDSWTHTATRAVRPWDSVILPAGVKEFILQDCMEFIEERKFYKDRGLPYRRGYMLYGVPGSGKSSLIAALAAKLRLDIYIVNLSIKGIDDATLQNLLQACPAKCILLMEDISVLTHHLPMSSSSGPASDSDCAFVDRDKLNQRGSNSRSKSKAKRVSKSKSNPQPISGSSSSFSSNSSASIMLPSPVSIELTTAIDPEAIVSPSPDLSRGLSNSPIAGPKLDSQAIPQAVSNTLNGNDEKEKAGELDDNKKKKKKKKRASSASSCSSSSSLSSSASRSRHRSRSDLDYHHSGVTLSGLLNALDGVASSEGRLFFCTTNWVNHIDPALLRPGRDDVCVEFGNTTRSQARDLFIQFYSATTSTALSDSGEIVSTEKNARQIAEPVTPVNEEMNVSVQVDESPTDLTALANDFSRKLPEGVVSVSALQGYLIRYKRGPQQAVDGVQAWVGGGYQRGPSTTLMSGKTV
ncbi:hypothetical protein IAU59_002351 [Kwoniella sp. CBS 9459]